MKEPVSSLNGILPPVAQQVFLHKPDFTGINMPGNRFPAPGTEGIDHQDLVTLCNESINKVRADEPGSSCHDIKHHYIICHPCYRITGMFIGIDHGTTAMRFAGESGEFKISREAALEFSIEDLSRICPVDEIEGIALCYSMGDNISSITHISKVKNRGLISRDGAGQHIGGGTRVFDEVAESGIPAVVIPGLHRGSPTDPRFKVYSHQSSPEKIGIAYEVSCALGDDVIVSDVSSNTVTLLDFCRKTGGSV